MQPLLPVSRPLQAVMSLAAVSLAVGLYFLHERVLEPLFDLPQDDPGADIIVLLILAIALSWFGFQLYARLQLHALEGLRDVLTQAGLGIAMLDRHGRILWYNPAIVELLGLEHESWVGRSAFDYLQGFADDEAVVRLREGMARLATGQVVHSEVEIRRRDGGRLAVSYAMSPLRGSHARLLGVLCILMDITERKRMAEELRASRDNLQRLIEAIPAGVAVVDAATAQPVLWNQAALRMTGLPTELDLGADQPEHFLFRGERRILDSQGHELGPADLPLQRTLRARKGVSDQHLEIKLDDGRQLDIIASTAFLDLPGGGQAVLIFQDISGIQRLHRELEAQRIQAEKMKAMLTTVATLNHEINNPLTGILGAADLLLDQPNLDEMVQRHTETIRELALRISQQVRNLNVATRFEQRSEKGFEAYLKIGPETH